MDVGWGSDPSPWRLRTLLQRWREGSDPIDAALFCSRRRAYIRPRARRRWRRRLAPSSARAGLSKPNLMTDDVETRRRRAVYRACHRGTKEMDWILGPLRRGGAAGACRVRAARPVRAPAGAARSRPAGHDPAPGGRAGRRVRASWSPRCAPSTDWSDGIEASHRPTSRSPQADCRRRRGQGDADRRAGGLAPLVLARLAEEAARPAAPPLLLHVARDDRRLEALAEGLAFFAPKVRVIQFPAWDTVPYDRIGPNAEIVATPHRRAGPPRRRRRARARPWCSPPSTPSCSGAPARVHPPLA